MAQHGFLPKVFIQWGPHAYKMRGQLVPFSLFRIIWFHWFTGPTVGSILKRFNRVNRSIVELVGSTGPIWFTHHWLKHVKVSKIVP